MTWFITVWACVKYEYFTVHYLVLLPFKNGWRLSFLDHIFSTGQFYSCQSKPLLYFIVCSKLLKLFLWSLLSYSIALNTNTIEVAIVYQVVCWLIRRETEKSTSSMVKCEGGAKFWVKAFGFVSQIRHQNEIRKKKRKYFFCDFLSTDFWQKLWQ